MTRAEMLAAVDVKAGAVRAKYITVAPGQEATYMLKSAQAKAFQQANYEGTVPGLVQAEATAEGDTVTAATLRILAEEAAWANLAASIESSRRSAKVAIAVAPNDATAEAIFNATIVGFSAYL